MKEFYTGSISSGSQTSTVLYRICAINNHEVAVYSVLSSSEMVFLKKCLLAAEGVWGQHEHPASEILLTMVRCFIYIGR